MHFCQFWLTEISWTLNNLPWHQTDTIVLSTWLGQKYGKQMQQKNLELFPRTDLPDLSYSHEMASVDSFSHNKFQKLSIWRNRMEEKKSRLRTKCHGSCISVFFYWVKVFCCLFRNTKTGLEKLHSDLSVEVNKLVHTIEVHLFSKATQRDIY